LGEQFEGVIFQLWMRLRGNGMSQTRRRERVARARFERKVGGATATLLVLGSVTSE
jgi:hypothetical protein